MEECLYELLNYIKERHELPSCEDLKVSKEKYINLIRKCNAENYLDEELVSVNIMEEVDYDDNVDIDMALTIDGIEFIKQHNPLGKVKK